MKIAGGTKGEAESTRTVQEKVEAAVWLGRAPEPSRLPRATVRQKRESRDAAMAARADRHVTCRWELHS
jgi:hypothetical protein